MTATDRHPPADRRCQIYFRSPELTRCRNTGTHWEKWGGCSCDDADADVCEGDFHSWECDDTHYVQEVADAA